MEFGVTGIACIRSDHGGEFENNAFETFCNNLGIVHQFLWHRNPEQNVAVEWKNRSIQEMARTMLNEISLPKYFAPRPSTPIVMF